MFQSDNTVELFKSLVSAQAEFTTVPFDKKNPHFGNQYASLSATQEMVRPILGKHNLAIVQSIESVDNVYHLETRLIHSSGEFIGSYLRLLIGKQDMQGLGSAITYAKRYSLQTMLGISGDEDDDAQASVNQSRSSNNNNSQLENKKTYPKVEPKDFILNLGNFKGVKLGTLNQNQLSEVGAWLSERIKSHPTDPKIKYYGTVYGNIKKLLAVEPNPAPEPPKLAVDEAENPFPEFDKLKDDPGNFIIKTPYLDSFRGQKIAAIPDDVLGEVADKLTKLLSENPNDPYRVINFNTLNAIQKYLSQ